MLCLLTVTVLKLSRRPVVKDGTPGACIVYVFRWIVLSWAQQLDPGMM
jgi:hypothetical protein